MSSSGEYSTLEDLITRATLEPTLLEIYVEGAEDAKLFGFVFERIGLDVSVFAISDRIEIRRPEVEALWPDYGERSKLQTAAAVLDLSLGSDGHSYCFVVDSDWAAAVGPIPLIGSSLIHTDGPSIEHYFFEHQSFSQALAVGLGASGVDGPKVRQILSGALRDLASARIFLANADVAIIEKFVALVTFKRDSSSADAVEIVRRSFNAANRAPEFDRDDVAQQVKQYRAWLDDVEHSGRGHDIAHLLIKYLGLKGAFASTAVVEAVVRAAFDPESMANSALFANLRHRLTGAHLVGAVSA